MSYHLSKKHFCGLLPILNPVCPKLVWGFLRKRTGFPPGEIPLWGLPQRRIRFNPTLALPRSVRLVADLRTGDPRYEPKHEKKRPYKHFIVFYRKCIHVIENDHQPNSNARIGKQNNYKRPTKRTHWEIKQL